MNLAEIKAAVEAEHPHAFLAEEVPQLRIERRWLVERVEELHKVATVLLGAYGRCAAYTLDDLHLSREEREWVDRVLAETGKP